MNLKRNTKNMTNQIEERTNEVLRSTLDLHFLLKKKRQDELANMVLAFGSSVAKFAMLSELGQRKEEYDRS